VYSVKIYGAGSIGNHLAHACRTKGWDVLMCDIDPDALKRTREDIYPSRYGRWDPALCTPSLDGVQRIVDLKKATGTFVAVGYNHTLTENSRRAARILAKNTIGDPITISACFREHWGGIFTAHPWLSGPKDTYLGFSERGGGASGEHSHAINIWQQFAHLVDAGRIVEVSSTMDMVVDGIVEYDRICLLNVKTQAGLVGDIAQDVVTEPPQKKVRIQGSSGFLEWFVNLDRPCLPSTQENREDQLQ